MGVAMAEDMRVVTRGRRRGAEGEGCRRVGGVVRWVGWSG